MRELMGNVNRKERKQGNSRCVCGGFMLNGSCSRYGAYQFDKEGNISKICPRPRKRK